MNITLSAEQEKRLEGCRRAFNRFTGQRLTLAQFIAFAVAEMIEENEQAATIAGAREMNCHVH